MIFSRLMANLQEIRDLMNSHFSSAHWVVSHGLKLDDISSVGIEITGFTRTKEKTEELIARGVKASRNSCHHVENACAVDFTAFFKRTKEVIPSKMVAEIISPKRWLYDYMMPHVNRAGKYFNPYSDDHVHLDVRGLAVALGVRKI